MRASADVSSSLVLACNFGARAQPQQSRELPAEDPQQAEVDCSSAVTVVPPSVLIGPSSWTGVCHEQREQAADSPHPQVVENVLDESDEVLGEVLDESTESDNSVSIKFEGVDVGAALPRRTMAAEDRSTGSFITTDGLRAIFDGGSHPFGHEGDECAVCLAPMLAGENVTDLPLCNHTFHHTCAANWLKSKILSGQAGCCPVCNQQIVSPVVVSRPSQLHQQPRGCSVLGSHFKILIALFILVAIVAALLFAHSAGKKPDRWT